MTARQVRLILNAPRAQAERIAALLEECVEGAWPLALDEIPDNPERWSVSVYAEEAGAAELAHRMQQALAQAGIAGRFTLEPVPELDWVSESLRQLHPVRAGRFAIAGSHDRDRLRPHERRIIIDAGQAFGTGHHGTTAGCLLMLDELLRQRRFRNALDLGTGSGVLAIGLALGARAQVLASDIDPVAVSVARENSRRNAVGPFVRCLQANGLRHPLIMQRAPFDLILANILAGPLKAMAGQLARLLAPGGMAILSGLLPEQEAAVMARYRAHGLILRSRKICDGWLVLGLQKGSGARNRC